VFADIERDTLTIDPQAISAAINPRTEAILATHVYGNPCDVTAIETIAARHGLAVIYDAAHAFAVRYQGRSLLSWGDLSMVSLHATKLFHTAEGGLMVGANQSALAKLEWMRRFGHNGPEAFHGVGTNAKMTELQAAIGLAVLPHVDSILAARQQICSRYDQALLSGSLPITKPHFREGTEQNFSYYPILLPDEVTLLRLKASLEQQQIFTRRYFYPSLSERFGDTATSTPVCGDVSRRVLCLPLSGQMPEAAVDRVIAGVLRGLAS
jgi:dTDP-4-amino-4,6-dideoxygalactose transaminase